MKLQVLSVGTKSPAWVRAGFDEYARRMPREMPLELIEIPAPRHAGTQNFMQVEGERMLAKLKPADWVVALDQSGARHTSDALAGRLAHWRDQGGNVAFLIGGSDGLAPELGTRANESISLSDLTFPHYLVRVLWAEALYRAWSIYAGHPYHRA